MRNSNKFANYGKFPYSGEGLPCGFELVRVEGGFSLVDFPSGGRQTEGGGEFVAEKTRLDAEFHVVFGHAIEAEWIEEEPHPDLLPGRLASEDEARFA